MYAGHFAVGFVLKTQEPRVPTWVLLLGTGLLDILFGIFVPLGIERATMVPGSSPGFRLDYIDWSHSLLMSLVWAFAFGALFLGKGKRIAAFAGVAVFSHYVLDLFMHPADLALWPNAAISFDSISGQSSNWLVVDRVGSSSAYVARTIL